MKRQSTLVREENYEHVLMCLICRSLFDDYDHQPKFLPCHHTFCKDCLREYVKQMGDDVECPSCRKVSTIPAAGVTALQTNFYVKYIQGLVHGAYVGDGGNTKCTTHTGESVQYYCKVCNKCVCHKCCAPGEESGKPQQSKCKDHEKVPITTITEECHHRLDKCFTRANSLVEHKRMETEALLKALSHEKDEALKRIDSSIEQHAHTLHRRGTLLKNKVIDVYNEHVTQLECDLEEISTAMTCIVSLKEYHEELIGRALCQEIDRGVADIDDVFENISTKIKPVENHIVYEEKHGVEKFKMAAKDLGRVRNSRPTVPRSDPEGGRDLPRESTTTSPSPQASDSEFSPVHGARLDHIVGAEAGACGGTDDNSQYPVIIDNDTNQHNDTCALSNQTCDSTRNGNPKQGDTNGNENRQGTATAQLDSNSNQPLMAARPKCFDMTKRKTKPNSNLTSAKPKSAQAHHNTSVYKKQSAGVLRELRSKQALVPTLKLIDPSKDEHPTLPDLDALKKTDKMYHHLVYTSYDEEELLKELKSGKVALADPNIVARRPEPDSRKTCSSDVIPSPGSDETPAE